MLISLPPLPLLLVLVRPRTAAWQSLHSLRLICYLESLAFIYDQSPSTFPGPAGHTYKPLETFYRQLKLKPAPLSMKYYLGAFHFLLHLNGRGREGEGVNSLLGAQLPASTLCLEALVGTHWESIHLPLPDPEMVLTLLGCKPMPIGIGSSRPMPIPETPTGAKPFISSPPYLSAGLRGREGREKGFGM